MKEVVGGVFFSPFSFLAGIFLDLGKLCIPYFRTLMFPKLPQYFYSFIAYCFPSLPQATSPSKHPTLHSDLNIFCSKGSLALFFIFLSTYLLSRFLRPHQPLLPALESPLQLNELKQQPSRFFISFFIKTFLVIQNLSLSFNKAFYKLYMSILPVNSSNNQFLMLRKLPSFSGLSLNTFSQIALLPAECKSL